MNKTKQLRKIRNTKKIRSKSDRIRLCVFKSSKYNYAQLVDDKNNKVIIGLSDKKILGKDKNEKAKKLGETIGKLANKKKINKVVFDRRNYKFHGRVKSVAEGARKEGLKM